MENSPYNLSVGPLISFVEHRHADIEFNYCIKGTREVIIDKKKYVIKEGEMSVIAPGVSHEFPPSEDDERSVLTGVVGSSFLKKHFSSFTSSEFRSAVINFDTCKSGCELRAALDSLVGHLNDETEKAALLIKGELYKVCAYLIDACASEKSGSDASELELSDIESIDAALEMIYYDYKKPLTIDAAAQITGYGKSNFCKIFKKCTGTTFHDALNKRRVAISCGLLSDTGLSIAEISEEVGFLEAKSFCRVFKSTEGMTPGAYRRAKKKRI